MKMFLFVWMGYKPFISLFEEGNVCLSRTLWRQEESHFDKYVFRWGSGGMIIARSLSQSLCATRAMERPHNSRPLGTFEQLASIQCVSRKLCTKLLKLPTILSFAYPLSVWIPVSL